MSNCTRCMNKPIYQNHMCKLCEEKHNEWLRAEAEKRSGPKSLRSQLKETVVNGLGKKLEQEIQKGVNRQWKYQKSFK